MATPTTEKEKRAHLREMINHIRAAVLVTRNQDGSMHGRPMSTADVDEHWDQIWFATARDSGKVAEIADDDHVYVAR